MSEGPTLKEKSAEAETRKHIMRVNALLLEVIQDLAHRAAVHDQSKLEEPEAGMFAAFTERLHGMSYSADPDSEYQKCLSAMRGEGLDPLQHHYDNNDHHPEHVPLLKCKACEAVYVDCNIEADSDDEKVCPACDKTQYRSVLEPHISVEGMTLLGVIEMLCDWKAAGERHHDGNIFKSIEINTKRFSLSPQLVKILTNTAASLWPPEPSHSPNGYPLD